MEIGLMDAPVGVLEQLEFAGLESLSPEEIAHLEAELPSYTDAEIHDGVFAFVGRDWQELKAYLHHDPDYFNDEVLLRLCGQLGFDSDFELGSDGFFEGLWRHLEGFKVSNDTAVGYVKLPVLQIHRPYIQGCATTVSYKRGNEDEKNIEISLLGASFKSKCRVEASCELQHVVRYPDDCSTIYYDAKISFKKWVYPGLPDIKPIYTVKDLWIDTTSAQIVEEVKGEHKCSLLDPDGDVVRSGDPRHVYSLDLRKAGRGGETNLKKLESSTTGKMVELNFGLVETASQTKLGSLSFSLETQVLIEYGIGIKLIPGANYIFHRPKQGSGIIWCSALNGP